MGEFRAERKLLNPERVWTLSNIISILRAALAAPIVISIHREKMILATIFIILAILSDFVDGFIARRNHQVTNLGKALDPIADKVCVFSAILYLITINRIPLIFFIILGARDILLAMMHVYLMNVKGVMGSANITGKISITFVAATLLSFIYQIEKYQQILMNISYFFLFISFIQYLLIFLRNFGRRGLPYDRSIQKDKREF